MHKSCETTILQKANSILLNLFAHRSIVVVVVVIVVVTVVLVVVVVMVLVVVVVVLVVVVLGSHPLHVLSHWPGNVVHKSCETTILQKASSILLNLFAHRSVVVVVVVIVVVTVVLVVVVVMVLVVVVVVLVVVVLGSHPLHVLSHWPGNVVHKSCETTTLQKASSILLNLFAHRSVVVMVVVLVVVALVVIAPTSHPLHALSQYSPSKPVHLPFETTVLQSCNDILLFLFAHPSTVVVVVVVVVAVLVSQPLHVLSHSPGSFAHKSMETNSVQYSVDLLLRLFAHRSVVVVVVLALVVLASQPLHVH